MSELGPHQILKEASANVKELPDDRTLMILQLTDEPEDDFEENTEGEQFNSYYKELSTQRFKTIDRVFDHFKPSVDVELSSMDGETVEENVQFNKLKDFDIDQISQNSELLSTLSDKKKTYTTLLRELQGNRKFIECLQSEDGRNQMISFLKEVSQTLTETQLP